MKKPVDRGECTKIQAISLVSTYLGLPPKNQSLYFLVMDSIRLGRRLEREKRRKTNPARVRGEEGRREDVNREIRNAQIRSTMLGVEDHGILTFMLHLEYGSSGQGFGGYALDEHIEERGERVGVTFGMEAIRQVLKVVGVEKWEDLVGKHVRADAGFDKVYRLGNIITDKWLDMEELAAKIREGGTT